MGKPQMGMLQMGGLQQHFGLPHRARMEAQGGRAAGTCARERAQEACCCHMGAASLPGAASVTAAHDKHPSASIHAVDVCVMLTGFQASPDLCTLMSKGDRRHWCTAQNTSAHCYLLLHDTPSFGAGGHYDVHFSTPCKIRLLAGHDTPDERPHLQEVKGAADVGDDLSHRLCCSLLHHDFYDCPHALVGE